MIRILVLLGIVAASCEVAAQDTLQWSQIDCSQSNLVVPPGLTCRATQNYAGAQHGGAGAEGTFRRWSAHGERNGARLFYYLAKATSPRAYMMPGTSLERVVQDEMRDGRMIHSFSQLSQRNGADYMTFTSAGGDNCVGIRRYGPSQGEGYLWILRGVRCEARGRPLTDREIDSFIASASYRGS